MLEVGSKAPDFELYGSDGKRHRLKDFRNGYLVLYFYPKDSTPGCTIEAKSFSTAISGIRRKHAEVVGVSRDDLASHSRFCSKYGLKILLLSDPSNKIIDAYDAYGDRGLFGRGTLRKTYVIGRDGRIVKIYQKVNPIGHGKEVLRFLSALTS
ncbi:MAG: peroxiredoxin [Candidatus Marsarchaeota archaeon]|nr:peroxiredoxin [Candidatus Marsarchaeota archaeon]